jgi:hypothetical protein
MNAKSSVGGLMQKPSILDFGKLLVGRIGLEPMTQ